MSLPETPLLGVLPGTGGLTRVVDKRKVRRDLADVFGTLAEGVKGKRAVEWRLVDAVVSDEPVQGGASRSARAELAATSDRPATGPGITLGPLDADGHRRRASTYSSRVARDRSRRSASRR